MTVAFDGLREAGVATRTAARSAGLNAWVGALRSDCGIGGRRTGGGPNRR